MGRRLGQLLAFFCALSGSAWAAEADTTALRGLAGAGMADGLELGSVRRKPRGLSNVCELGRWLQRSVTLGADRPGTNENEV